MNPTLVLIPSELECRHLCPPGALADTSTPFKVWRKDATFWAIVGVGAAAAGVSTAALIHYFQPEKVLLVGIAGAFPGSGLELGQVVEVAEDQFADLGYETEGQLVNLNEMHLPMLPGQKTTYSTVFPIITWSQLEAASVKAITVNRITSSAARAALLFKKFGAELEQMEGAGVALACSLLQIPFFHIRGISNVVGPRDPKTWQVGKACDALSRWLQEKL